MPPLGALRHNNSFTDHPVTMNPSVGFAGGEVRPTPSSKSSGTTVLLVLKSVNIVAKEVKTSSKRSAILYFFLKTELLSVKIYEHVSFQ